MNMSQEQSMCVPLRNNIVPFELIWIMYSNHWSSKFFNMQCQFLLWLEVNYSNTSPPIIINFVDTYYKRKKKKQRENNINFYVILFMRFLELLLLLFYRKITSSS